MDEQANTPQQVDNSRRPIVSSQTDDEESVNFLQLAGLARMETRRLANGLLTTLSVFIESMADAGSSDCDATRERLSHARAALLYCVRRIDCSLDAVPKKNDRRPVRRGRLKPWQVRSLTHYIDANLEATLACQGLARLVGLSVSHFSRAFKGTLGYSPHVFVLCRRVERAKGLMLNSNAQLAQIATECGFADQAHLSRVFLQFTGASPASWRRARTIGAEERAAAPVPPGGPIEHFKCLT